jgi:hypothetical protein
MIYVLLANGASALPLFIPVLPQLLLVMLALRHFDQMPFRNSLCLYYFALMSAFILVMALDAAFSSDSELFLKYFKLLINSGFALVAAAALVAHYREQFPSVYTNAIVAMSAAGIAGLLLTLGSEWHIAVNIGDRNYLTNFLTVWISDDGFNSSQAMFSPFKYRLQSFFDEPGTFGMLLLPALYHAINAKRGWQVMILVVSVFLSESANAWIGALLLFSLYIFNAGSTSQKILAVLTIAGVALAFGDLLKTLYDVKMGIDAAYATNSSFGTRALEYGYLADNILEHALPLSHLNHAAQTLPGISSSYVDWVVHAGWAFIGLLFSSAIVTGGTYVKIWLKMSSSNYFPFVLALTLLLSGFQRTSVFDNVLFMTLFYWAIMFRLPRTEEQSHGGC